MLNKVTVLLCRQGRVAEVVETENSLAGVQSLLGANDLETVKPRSPDVSVVYSHAAQLRDLPVNRRIYSEDLEDVTELKGDFIIGLMPRGCREFLPMSRMVVDRYNKLTEMVL